MTRLVVIIACLAWSAPGVSGDREFDGLVRRIEARNETDQVHIPLFGLVNFFVKLRPGGR